ncbi:MAG: EamA family transporter [Parabacteroides sp.]|jgi:transporter family protein|uniref:EamA family transporter n=1 Tax=Macellibacteroides sp. TaxID=2014584 RepID=UPI002A326BE1|nr:EamA family transporter [Candidatus Cloacimonadota bacterium]
MWKYYAVLSAIFAALTAIFAKIGIKNVDSNLATAIRTCVILLLTWSIVLAGNGASGIKDLTKTNWTFLILSGVATGLSWLFYFKALQIGEASKVAPIDKLSVVFTIFLSFLILGETVSWKVILGGCMIAGGSLVILMDK